MCELVDDAYKIKQIEELKLVEETQCVPFSFWLF